MAWPLLFALASLSCADPRADPRAPVPVTSGRAPAAPPPEVAAAIDLGNKAQAAARYDEALAHYEQALRATPAADGLGTARLYNLIGRTRYEKVEPDEALALYDKALALQVARLAPQDPELGRTRVLRAQALWLKGDNDAALLEFEAALLIQLATSGEESPQVGGTDSNIGNVYWAKGDYEQALVFYQKALLVQRRVKGPDHVDVANTLHNMAISSMEKGEHDRSLALEAEALAIFVARLGPAHPDLAESYIVMAQARTGKGEHAAALALLRQARAIQVAAYGDQHAELAWSYSSMADVHLAKREFARALALYQRTLALELASFGNLHPEVAEDYLRIGDVYAARGDHVLALASYQRSLQANVPGFTAGDPRVNPPLPGALSEEHLLEALERKARTFAALGDTAVALVCYEDAARLIDRMRSGYQAEASKLFLAERVGAVYEGGVAAALRLYERDRDPRQRERAFFFAEKGKAGVLLEAIAGAQARRFAGIPGELLEQERKLRVDLAFYDRQRSERKLEAGADVASLQERVFALEREREAVERRLETDYPRYFDLKYRSRTASLSELQAGALSERSALVEYVTGVNQLFIFAVTRETVTTAVVSSSGLEADVEALRRSIMARDVDAYPATAHRIYRTLVEPVATAIAGRDLILVPDGPLAAVPFEALVTRPLERGALAEPHYLLHDHAVSYAYSATLLQRAGQGPRASPDRSYAAFAPVVAAAAPEGSDELTRSLAGRGPLPASRREVEGVARRFRERESLWDRLAGRTSRVYLGSRATEERVKSEELAGYRYVHFATHGIAHPQDPRLSGLLLAAGGSRREDGVLHLGEIYELRLNADLVVLSACETGLGRQVRGEGVIGLTRAFLYAGAARVLVSLWPVSDDSTADLMLDLYQGLLAGSSPAGALRAAKLRMLGRDPEHAKPYFWSAFVLVGS